MNTEECSILKRNGITPTPQRRAIYCAVAGRCDHPSADAVFRELRASMPSLSKTTVYATLQLLAERRLIGCVHQDGDEVRYDGTAAFHAHFRCRTCGRIYDVKAARTHRKPFVPVPENFRVDNEELTYYGVCPNCLTKHKNNKRKGK